MVQVNNFVVLGDCEWRRLVRSVQGKLMPIAKSQKLRLSPTIWYPPCVSFYITNFLKKFFMILRRRRARASPVQIWKIRPSCGPRIVRDCWPALRGPKGESVGSWHCSNGRAFWMDSELKMIWKWVELLRKARLFIPSGDQKIVPKKLAEHISVYLRPQILVERLSAAGASHAPRTTKMTDFTFEKEKYVWKKLASSEVTLPPADHKQPTTPLTANNRLNGLITKYTEVIGRCTERDTC